MKLPAPGTTSSSSSEEMRNHSSASATFVTIAKEDPELSSRFFFKPPESLQPTARREAANRLDFLTCRRSLVLDAARDRNEK